MATSVTRLIIVSTGIGLAVGFALGYSVTPDGRETDTGAPAEQHTSPPDSPTSGETSRGHRDNDTSARRRAVLRNAESPEPGREGAGEGDSPAPNRGPPDTRSRTAPDDIRDRFDNAFAHGSLGTRITWEVEQAFDSAPVLRSVTVRDLECRETICRVNIHPEENTDVFRFLDAVEYRVFQGVRRVRDVEIAGDAHQWTIYVEFADKRMR